METKQEESVPNVEENLPAGEETPAVEDAPLATDNEVPPGEQGPPPDDANRAEVAEVAAGLLNIGVDIDPHEHLYSATTFDELNLPAPIQRALIETLGYKRPFKIQAQALPQILMGKDLIAQAKTGTGKTVAFVVGMLTNIDLNSNSVQALCLTSSREVAHQIMGMAVIPLTSFMPELKAALLLPGESPRHLDAQLIVATPGKAKELVGKKVLRLDQLKVLVLDEADKMISSVSDTKQVLQRLPPTSQRLLFSATYTPETLKLAKAVVRPRSNNGDKPVVLRLAAPQAQILDEIKQIWVDVRKSGGDRLGLLKEMYASLTLVQSIVFVNTRVGAEEVKREMEAEGYEVSLLHGGLEHAVRDQLMREFREGKRRLLITTDVLSRGVDVETVRLVVNYHIPLKFDDHRQRLPDPETYVHRIGRTGRAGRRGIAVTFVASQEDKESLQAIERFYSPDQEMIAEWHAADFHLLDETLQKLNKPAASATSEEKS